ncbi:hypothetical protein [Clostridium paraputrificum]|uniref:hypothetical protein n=1 Tax=Clostridium paraputrificum TaxID=29363 RepID=UPI001B3C9985|nr:hypothetical protein [Clostridium paraputrificum]
MAITLEEMREKHNSVIEHCRQTEGFDIAPLMSAFAEIEKDYEGTLTTMEGNTTRIETLQNDLSKAKDEIYNMFMTRGVPQKEDKPNEPQNTNSENHQSIDDYIKQFEG